MIVQSPRLRGMPATDIAVRLAPIVLVVVAALACGRSDAGTAPLASWPAAHASLDATRELVAAETAIGELPEWIASPARVPSGLVGIVDCSFPFGQIAMPGFHADAACWERPGPDGFVRQQFTRIHVASFPQCNGGPGDAEAIRVCKEGGAGQPTPCGEPTGPTGCARCIVNPTCH